MKWRFSAVFKLILVLDTRDWGPVKAPSISTAVCKISGNGRLWPNCFNFAFQKIGPSLQYIPSHINRPGVGMASNYQRPRGLDIRRLQYFRERCFGYHAPARKIKPPWPSFRASRNIATAARGSATMRLRPCHCAARHSAIVLPLLLRLQPEHSSCKLSG